MRCIEVFVVLTVRTLDFSVMPWRVRSNKVVLYTTLFEASIKQRGRPPLGGQKPLCELSTVVSLHALYRKWERLYQVFKKLS